MRKIIEWIKSLFAALFKKKENSPVKTNNVLLETNASYIKWIESIERQVQQVKIDYALGWICKETYEMHMLDFQNKVKEISQSYLNYLKVNHIPISHDLATI